MELDTNRYEYFVFKRAFNPHYGFTNYSDRDGNLRMIVNKKDKDGNPIPRHFKFSQAHRTMRIPKSQVDIVGNNVVDFLKEHPECEGSPNGVYVKDPKTGEKKQMNVFFGVMDTERDADIAIEAKSKKLEAENKAMALEGEDLQDMAAMIGVYGKSEGIAKHKLLEYAGTSPDAFLELTNRKDVKAISLVRRGINTNVLSKKGNVISWEDTVLGTDEQRAAKTLMDDDKMFEALQDAIQRMK